jgi:hypothetical protein
MIESFFGSTYDEKLNRYNRWLEDRYDIRAYEVIDGQNLLNRIPLFPPAPKGYKLTVELKIEKIDE